MRSPVTFGDFLLVFTSDMPGLAWRRWSVGGTPLAIRAPCRPRFIADHAKVGLAAGREPTCWSAIT